MVPMGGAHVAARRGVLAGQLGAVILGILGMHALVQHCPTPAHAMQLPGVMTSMSGTAAVETHDHAGTAADAGATGLPIVGAVVTGAGSGSHGDMLMLCAAMLLGAGAVLVLALRQRRAPAHVILPRGPSVARPKQSVLRLIRAGPPPIMAFSVIRC